MTADIFNLFQLTVDIMNRTDSFQWYQHPSAVLGLFKFRHEEFVLMKMTK